MAHHARLVLIGLFMVLSACAPAPTDTPNTPTSLTTLTPSYTPTATRVPPPTATSAPSSPTPIATTIAQRVTPFSQPTATVTTLAQRVTPLVQPTPANTPPIIGRIVPSPDPRIFSVRQLLVGPGQAGRLYALMQNQVPSYESENVRLLVSDDAGKTWSPFAGGFPKDCINSLTLDYTTTDALYVSGCKGTYHWTGSAWAVLSSEPTLSLAITYGDAQQLWATHARNNFASLELMRSDNGGQTWRSEPLGGMGLAVAIRPRKPNLVYALSGYKSWWYDLYRSAGDGQWKRIPTPKNADGFPSQLINVQGMTLDGATGALYLAMGYVKECHPPQLWRVPNPDALNENDVRWELVHDFGLDRGIVLLSSGSGPNGLTLYANIWNGSEQCFSDRLPTLHRSRDGGQTWEPMTLPAAK